MGPYSSSSQLLLLFSALLISTCSFGSISCEDGSAVKGAGTVDHAEGYEDLSQLSHKLKKFDQETQPKNGKGLGSTAALLALRNRSKTTSSKLDPDIKLNSSDLFTSTLVSNSLEHLEPLDNDTSINGTASEVLMEEHPTTSPTPMEKYFEDLKCGLFKGDNYEESQSFWNVALGYYEDSGVFSFVCGGVLIDPRTVLTSASCLSERKVNAARMSQTFHNISSIITHPDFVPGVIYNDISLTRLAKPLKIDSNILPCIPPSFQPNTTSEEYQSLSVKSLTTDWLFLLKESYLVLHPTTRGVRVVPNQECEVLYRHYFRIHSMKFEKMFPRGIDSTLVCSERLYDNNHCEDHRGFQMICRPNEYSYFVTGTRTAGELFCDFMKLPGIYTSVHEYSDWIQRNL